MLLLTECASIDSVILQNKKLPRNKCFSIKLGSIVSRDGDIGNDVTNRVLVGWIEWGSAWGSVVRPQDTYKDEGEILSY